MNEKEMAEYYEMYNKWMSSTIPYITWATYCTKLLEKLMIENKDVLERLKKV